MSGNNIRVNLPDKSGILLNKIEFQVLYWLCPTSSKYHLLPQDNSFLAILHMLLNDSTGLAILTIFILFVLFMHQVLPIVQHFFYLVT